MLQYPFVTIFLLLDFLLQKYKIYDFLACAAILRLTFVPPTNVVQAFSLLQQNCMKELQEVITLFENYYVLGKRRGRGRQPPMFPIESWNVYARTADGIPRTNNSVEGWNRRFNTIVAKAHPNVYALIEALRGEELYSSAQKELLSTGSSPPHKRRKYVKNDDRLQRLCDRFEEFLDEEDGEGDVWKEGVLGFVRRIGHSARGVMDFIQEEEEQEEEDDDEA